MADLVNGEWNDAVVQGDIPDTPIAGTINNKDFTIPYVVIDQKLGGEFEWSFSDTAPEESCGFVTDNDEVIFRSKDFQAGTFYKAMEGDVEFSDYHSYYKYIDEEGSPYSVNVGWEAQLVIDEFDPAVTTDDYGNNTGTVSGWAEITYDDGETQIAGSFEGELCDFQT